MNTITVSMEHVYNPNARLARSLVISSEPREHQNPWGIQVAMGWDDYSIFRRGITAFRHDVHNVFLENFCFEVGDRFTYTYNVFEDWLCDI